VTADAPLLSPATLGVNIDQARADGWVVLTPMQQRVAIEFATSGMSAKDVAKACGETPAFVRQCLANPIIRAFISDLHAEISKHKIINSAWVEQQLLEQWPKLTGEEEVPLINAKEGISYNGKKYHSAEVVAVLKHFSGNGDQKKAGGVQVVINFGDMGVSRAPPIKSIDVSGAEDA
jgi:predicted transcriptional regulator